VEFVMAESARDPTERASTIDFSQAKTHFRTPHPDDRHRLGRGQARPAPLEFTVPAAAPAARRVASLDALRGFTIFWILGGDALAWALKEMSSDKSGALSAAGRFVGTQLQHVDWEGFRFYDLIFPMFIFVTGVSIVFSLSVMVERDGRSAAHTRVLRRSALLFVLGLLYYGGVSTNWPDIRLLGVLQRIALCYLFASLLFLNFRPRGLIATFVTLLVGYWALMTFVPVPGIGAGQFAPGANLADWIDEQYLPGRKWNPPWDPEGMLSTLPAIATCLLGVFAGMLLKTSELSPRQKSLLLAGAGIVLVAAGFLWSLQFPIIKNIWTSSFVLVAGGFSLLLLGAFYQVIDNWGQRSWSGIFMWLGANAITLYFVYGFVDFQQAARRFVGGDVGDFLDTHLTTGTANFAAAAVSLALVIAIANFLYRRKIFLRV
jgi:predicted acyltransferase